MVKVRAMTRILHSVIWKRRIAFHIKGYILHFTFFAASAFLCSSKACSLSAKFHIALNATEMVFSKEMLKEKRTMIRILLISIFKETSIAEKIVPKGMVERWPFYGLDIFQRLMKLYMN